ncbi:Lsr2 family DNA-binding protein [Actinacidiphila sp. bgisy145]|uniref:Lsr2 family DNA-binding protein n=1 Tax=Actinacidiphila sp. bgisy145 TaxID=3413792 RepID=UPI003EBF0909
MSITDITPHSTPVAPAPPREQAAPQPPTPSAAEPAGIPTDPDGLILWGAAHQSSRMQTLAGKARGALTDLRQAAERETKVAEAEARVARLKAQLENAQHDLASAKGAPKTKGTTAPAEDYAAIRAWAREQGIEVGRVGRPKREVVDAYHAAQQPQQLATAS